MRLAIAIKATRDLHVIRKLSSCAETTRTALVVHVNRPDCRRGFRRERIRTLTHVRKLRSDASLRLNSDRYSTANLSRKKDGRASSSFFVSAENVLSLCERVDFSQSRRCARCRTSLSLSFPLGPLFSVSLALPASDIHLPSRVRLFAPMRFRRIDASFKRMVVRLSPQW